MVAWTPEAAPCKLNSLIRDAFCGGLENTLRRQGRQPKWGTEAADLGTPFTRLTAATEAGQPLIAEISPSPPNVYVFVA